MREKIEEIVKQYSDLTDFGFGVYPGQSFEVERAKMFEPRSMEEMELAVRWLAGQRRTKTVWDGSPNSYGLKHLAENDIGYVTNGMFIAAGISIGLLVKRDGPNAVFNLSRKTESGRLIRFKG